MVSQFIFREIVLKSELEQFLRLRYDVYSRCANKIFLRENTSRIDLDVFDRHARHFCLMKKNQQVGYLRIVLPKEELCNTKILEIEEKFSLSNPLSDAKKESEAPFPFLSYQGVPKSHWAFFKKLEEKSILLAEASRLILHPDFRNVRVSKFLIECAIALYINICGGHKYAIVNCNERHGRFYKYYGFREISSGETTVIHGLKKVSLKLPPETTAIPNLVREDVCLMANQLNTTGELQRAI